MQNKDVRKKIKDSRSIRSLNSYTKNAKYKINNKIKNPAYNISMHNT